MFYEILTGQLSDYLVPRRDPKALALAIERVLMSELDLAEADILGKVTASKISQQYISLAR